MRLRMLHCNNSHQTSIRVPPSWVLWRRLWNSFRLPVRSSSKLSSHHLHHSLQKRKSRRNRQRNTDRSLENLSQKARR